MSERHFLIFWFLVGAGFLHAQNYEKISPRGVTPQNASIPVLPSSTSDSLSDDTEEIIPELKSIWFASSPSKLETISSPEQSIQGLFSIDLPLLKESKLQSRLKPFLGKPASMKSLKEIAKIIVQYYALKDRPVVDVWIPEQEDVSQGVVKMVVSESKMGSISVTGNRYFKKSDYFDAIELQEGGQIDTNELREGLRASNRNPFNQVNATFSPGFRENTTDVKFQVKDRFPAQFYTGYEDSGTALTGSDRLYAGGLWGNAFGQRHLLGYQFTTSPDLEKMRAHSASYTVPLPNRHEWSIQGSYAESEAALAAPFELKGKSWTVGTLYWIPLRSGDSWEHEVEGGFDFKQTNSNLDFGQSNVFQHLADINNYLLGYRWKMRDSLGKTEASLHGYYNPGEGTSNNNDQAVRNLRAFAESQYFYSRGVLTRELVLPFDFRYEGKFSGQYTSDSLPPSEMWNVGGWETVRGYGEYAASGDRGWMASHEFQTPGIHFGNWIQRPELQDELRFIAFFDMGWTQNLKTLQGEKEDHYLIGTGFGLRYQLNAYLRLRFDYGYQLHEQNLDGRGNQRAHLGLVLSY